MVDQNRYLELLDAVSAMFFAHRALTLEPDEMLAARGLARVHHRIMFFVGRQPGLSVNTLLKTLGVSKQAVNAPMRHLQQQGLIVATAARHDRRVKELRLTEAGEVLVRELGANQVRLLEAAFGRAGQADEAAWRRVMDLMGESVRPAV